MSTFSTPSSLEAYYDELLAGLPVRNNPDYSSLVIPTGNSAEPVHRWFRLKEAFSHALIPRLIKDHAPTLEDQISILDPFSGSGTSIVSGASLVQANGLKAVRVDAVESNPFLHLLGQSKARFLTDPPTNFETFAAKIVARANALEHVSNPPTLSTFNRADFFQPTHLRRLIALRDAIAQEPDGCILDDLARVCLAAAIEPASYLRRDGRTLRHVPAKLPRDPFAEFIRVARMIHDDASSPVSGFAARVFKGDSRELASIANDTKYNLAAFSPPYPNNIDYTEIYKLETWLLDMTASQEEFTCQRHRTLRSHASLTWREDYSFAHNGALRDLIEPILQAIPSDRYARGRRQVVSGYVDDMMSVISQISGNLKVGGLLACVVGNSLHGRPSSPLLIASDILIAKICEFVGLEVVVLEVARYPSRRRTASSHLRETVIIARKVENDVEA